jgi:hypothetical protein
MLTISLRRASACGTINVLNRSTLMVVMRGRADLASGSPVGSRNVW